MITPLGPRLIVDPIDPLNRTPGGLVIPDAHLPKPQRGKVLAVGSGMVTSAGVRVPMEIEVGDVVLYGKHSGSVVDIDGREVLFLMEQEIFGIDREYAGPEPKARIGPITVNIAKA
jgi:chaperonin GroES